VAGARLLGGEDDLLAVAPPRRVEHRPADPRVVALGEERPRAALVWVDHEELARVEVAAQAVHEQPRADRRPRRVEHEVAPPLVDRRRERLVLLEVVELEAHLRRRVARQRVAHRHRRHRVSEVVGDHELPLHVVVEVPAAGEAAVGRELDRVAVAQLRRVRRPAAVERDEPEDALGLRLGGRPLLRGGRLGWVADLPDFAARGRPGRRGASGKFDPFRSGRGRRPVRSHDRLAVVAVGRRAKSATCPTLRAPGTSAAAG
jgi:hypothetical protein